MGVFKVDWALDASDSVARARVSPRASTVHVVRDMAEIARSEQRRVDAARSSERPFVLLVQPTLFDPSRAPAGKHTAWAYCHVPSGSTADMLPRIEAQIERFAPGFRDRVLARSVMTPADIERAQCQSRRRRHRRGRRPTCASSSRGRRGARYSTPLRGLYICSARRRPASACTACADISPRSARSRTCTLKSDALSALSTDLYELTMIGGYYVRGMSGRATFDLFVRQLPPTRNYLVSRRTRAGARFPRVAALHAGRDRFLGPSRPSRSCHARSSTTTFAAFRFTGDVWAIEEGHPYSRTNR